MVETTYPIVTIVLLLAALIVGISLGMILLFLQSMMSALKKFHENMDKTHAAFEQLQGSMREQVQSQVRMSEVWKRTRKEQFEEAEGEQKAAAMPQYRQDWRAGA